MDPEYYFALSFFAVIWGIVLVIGLAVFILQAFGLYSLSKNTGYDKPWLAFIPVANSYVLGHLSDEANLRTKGKRTNNRKLLLGLHIGLAAFVLLLAVLLIAIIASADASMYSYSYNYYDGYNYHYNASMLPMTLLPILLLFIVPLAIVTAVFTYIALYPIYKAYAPENAEMYLVLSILVSPAYKAAGAAAWHATARLPAAAARYAAPWLSTAAARYAAPWLSAAAARYATPRLSAAAARCAAPRLSAAAAVTAEWYPA